MLFSIRDGGTLELSGGFEIEGEWIRLEKTCLEAWLLETLFSTDFMVQD